MLYSISIEVFSESEHLSFEFDEDAHVYKSCSTTYKNEFFVFGGSTSVRSSGGNERQISKVAGCRLQRIGSLDFDLEQGACTGVNDKRIYLCFNSDSRLDGNKCWHAKEPLLTFEKAASSYHGHTKTSIAASDCESTQLLLKV